MALFRRLGDHVAAGDLLRRIGQEDEAIEEYRLAADLLALVEREGGHLAAGDLLLSKIGDCVLARTHFRLGWGRTGPNAVSCALRLLKLDAAAGNFAAVRELLDDASDFFAWNRDLAQVERFYNELAILPAQGEGAVAAAHAELRDRALIGLTSELRALANPGTSAAALVATLARPDAWPAAVISDADFAITAATRVPRPAPTALRTPAPADNDPGVHWLRAGRGVVTAFCAARETGEVFIGFEDGQVLVVRPEQSEVACVAEAEDALAVTALAISSDAAALVTLRSHERTSSNSGVTNGRPARRTGPCSGSSCRREVRTILASPQSLPGPKATRWGSGAASELSLLDVSSLAIMATVTGELGEFSPPVLLLPFASQYQRELPFTPFAYNGRAWTLFDFDGLAIEQTSLNWRFILPAANPLRSRAHQLDE